MQLEIIEIATDVLRQVTHHSNNRL